MLQEEFQKLAGMEVSQEEYSHIEAVYMASTLNKEQFVHYWKLMNNDRILQYKAHMRAKKYYDILKEKARFNEGTLVCDTVQKRALKYLESLDIDVYESVAQAIKQFETEGTCAHHWAF